MVILDNSIENNILYQTLKQQLLDSLKDNKYNVSLFPTIKRSMALIESTLFSRYVTRELNEPPVNLMLIAPPSSGKSMTLKRYLTNKNIMNISDLSAKGLEDYILLKRSMTTLIITDFIRVLNKDIRTANNLTSSILSAIEDGYKGSLLAKTNKPLKKPHYLQLITALTPEVFDFNFIGWQTIGFLDRFIIVDVSYSHEESKVLEYLDYAQFKPDLTSINLTFPKDRNKKNIEISKEILKRVPYYSSRKFRNLQILLKGFALKENLSRLTLENGCLPLDFLNQLDRYNRVFHK